jgi:hypothetical protein
MTTTKRSKKLTFRLLAWSALAVLQISTTAEFVFFTACMMVFLGLLGAIVTRLLLGSWASGLPSRIGFIFLFLLSSTVPAWLTHNSQEQASTVAAQPIITALEQFRAANGVYPKSLDDLVPVYLPAVPKTKMGFYGTRFEYYSENGNDFFIGFEGTMMFRFYNYNSKTKRWLSLD